jgi:putative transposase
MYRFISNHSAKFPVERMCKVSKVSRSSYYEHLEGSVSRRAQENQKLLLLIKNVYQKSKQRYGSLRIHQTLRAEKVEVSRPRVARLMKQVQIKTRIKRRFKATTDSKHAYAVSENRFKRNFTVTAIGQASESDLTYIRIITGWLYLTMVLDLADRKMMRWALSQTLKAKDSTVATLKRLLETDL